MRVRTNKSACGLRNMRQVQQGKASQRRQNLVSKGASTGGHDTWAGKKKKGKGRVGGKRKESTLKESRLLHLCYQQAYLPHEVTFRPRSVGCTCRRSKKKDDRQKTKGTFKDAKGPPKVTGAGLKKNESGPNNEGDSLASFAFVSSVWGRGERLNAVARIACANYENRGNRKA